MTNTQPPPARFTKKYRRLGFLGYDDYLNSPKWARIRARVMDRDGHKCRKCGGPAEVVHHTAYSKTVLKGKQDWRLVSLCHSCHKLAEFDGDRKTNLQEANVRLGVLNHPSLCIVCKTHQKVKKNGRRHLVCQVCFARGFHTRRLQQDFARNGTHQCPTQTPVTCRAVA